MGRAKHKPRSDEWLYWKSQAVVPVNTYKSRTDTLGWEPQAAATIRDGVLKRKPDSVRSLCRNAGIDPRRYYDIKEELNDMGVEYTKEDIIDIAVARKAK